MLRVAKVEAEKGEIVGVVHDRDGRNRTARHLPDEESGRVRREECQSVVVPRIPAFGRRPVEHGPEVREGHALNRR